MPNFDGTGPRAGSFAGSPGNVNRMGMGRRGGAGMRRGMAGAAGVGMGMGRRGGAGMGRGMAGAAGVGRQYGRQMGDCIAE